MAVQAPQKAATGVRRVNVNFSAETYEMLAKMAETKGTTMTEILRQAISLAKFADDVAKKGDRILVDRGGKISEVLIR